MFILGELLPGAAKDNARSEAAETTYSLSASFSVIKIDIIVDQRKTHFPKAASVFP